MGDDEGKTPPYREPLSPADPDQAIRNVDRRTRDTAEISRSTLDKVGELRREIAGHLGRQDERVLELSEHVAGVDGKLDILLEILAENRREASQIRISQVTARVEVDKSREMALIDDEADRKRKRRELILAVWGAIGTIGTAIAAAMAAS